MYTYAVTIYGRSLGVSLYSPGEYMQQLSGEYKADLEDDPLGEEDLSSEPCQFARNLLTARRGLARAAKKFMEMTEEEANTWLELSRAAQMGLPALG